MSKPEPKNRATNSSASLLGSDNPLQEMYERPLTKADEEQMMFNLVNFVETLIAMDKQHKQWTKENKQLTKEQQNG